MNKKALIIFIKNPIIGTAKTRLAATIGDEKALAVYLDLLEHTRQITSEVDADKYVFYSRFIDESDEWDAAIFHKKLQVEGDLGIKMKQAFQEIFEKDYQQIALIGSDCGDLTTKHIHQAFKALDKSSIAIGPADDGGYYLLGMTQLQHRIFDNKSWSTSALLKETIEELKTQNITYQLLEQLNDVDTYEDWLAWQQGKKAAMSKDAARALLLYHSFMHKDVHHPKMEKGFLGMLRHFQGELIEDNFHELMLVIRVLADELNGEQKTVDKEIMSAIWGIAHYARSWGLHPDDWLQKNKLISKEQGTTLENWLDTLSYVMTSLLGGTDVETAFEFYEEPQSI